MAPFNKGEIGYIKAIANVGGHTTFKRTVFNGGSALSFVGSNATHCGHGAYSIVTVGKPPQCYNAGSSDVKVPLNNARPYVHAHDVYEVAVNTDEQAVGMEERVTPECYLESVNTRMRLIQQLDADQDYQTHQEYRMVVFRHKERQSSDERFAENFSNPLYDLFLATHNYKYGPLGFRKPSCINDSNDYVDASNPNNDAQSLMTNMLNKEDYVIMKDCRFYLGKEYGGKHIYEDRFHWNHGDPICTQSNDLTLNESNNKNYTWMIALFCTTNTTNAGTVAFTPQMPYFRLDSTTHVTSG